MPWRSVDTDFLALIWRTITFDPELIRDQALQQGNMVIIIWEGCNMDYVNDARVEQTLPHFSDGHFIYKTTTKVHTTQ